MMAAPFKRLLDSLAYIRSCATLGRGLARAEENRTSEAITILDAHVRRFGNSVLPTIQSHVAHALATKAGILMKSKELDGATAVYSDLLRRIRAGSYVDRPGLGANAMYNRAITLHESGQRDAAVEQYRELVREFEDSADGEITIVCLKGLFNKGSVLMELGRLEEAVQDFDLLIDLATRKMAPSNDLQAAALLNKGAALSDSGRSGEAQRAFQELIQLFQDNSDAAVQICVCEARERVGS